MLMSDVGGGNVNNVTLVLSNGAAALPSSSLVSGTFRPTNLSDSSPGGDNFPSPAPAGPYGSALSVFNGQTANGTWSLYCVDDGPGDQGSIAGGWSLTLTTSAAAPSPLRPLSSVATEPATISVTVNGHGLYLTVTGEIGLTYALEASNDLVNWSEVAAQENTTGTIVFQEQATPTGNRFYRAVRHLTGPSD
jgi:hypothetical protein